MLNKILSFLALGLMLTGGTMASRIHLNDGDADILKKHKSIMDAHKKELANKILGQSDVKAAARKCAKKAVEGHMHDMTYIGVALELGCPRENLQPNPTAAVWWYERAADKGSRHAELCLADLYFYGKGVEKNLPKYFEWLTKAANHKRNEEALILLGICKKMGWGPN